MTWEVLPIAASSIEGLSGILTNFAYTDKINSFSHRQIMQPAAGDVPTPYYALELQGGPATGGDHGQVLMILQRAGNSGRSSRIFGCRLMM